jgi:hypothetical protein
MSIPGFRDGYPKCAGTVLIGLGIDSEATVRNEQRIRLRNTNPWVVHLKELVLDFATVSEPDYLVPKELRKVKQERGHSSFSSPSAREHECPLYPAKECSV